MKLKSTTFSLILIGLASIACRQAEETLIEQEEQVSLQEYQMTAKEDSASSSSGFENNDPPKNGTHWKTAAEDTIKVITPKNFVGVLSDSNSSTIIDDEEPKDPPKNGTHWKAK